MNKFYMLIIATLIVFLLTICATACGAGDTVEDSISSTCIITFYSNGGTGAMEPEKVVKGGTFVLLANEFNAPTGQMFKCWLVGTEEKLPGQKVTIESDTIIGAIWQPISTQGETNKNDYGFSYTISYDANGGSGTIDPTIVEYGATYALPECTFLAPEEKIFKTWEIDGEEKSVGYSFVVSGDVSIKALWKDIDTAPIILVNDYSKGVSLSSNSYDIETPDSENLKMDSTSSTHKFKIASISGVELYRLYVFHKSSVDVNVEVTYSYSNSSIRTVQDAQTKLINAVSSYGKSSTSSDTINTSISIMQGTGEKSKWQQQYSGTIGYSITNGCTYNNAQELTRQSTGYISQSEEEITNKSLIITADYNNCALGYYRVSIKGDATIYEIVEIDYLSKQISSSYYIDYDYSSLYLDLDKSDTNNFDVGNIIKDTCDLSKDDIKMLYENVMTRKADFLSSRLMKSVSFNLNDDIGSKASCSSTGKEVMCNDKYGELPTPYRNGHKFTGWIDSNGQSINAQSTVTKETDHSLFATWQANLSQTYTIDEVTLHGWANDHTLAGYSATFTQLDLEYIKANNMTATISFSFHITEKIDCYQVFAIASDAFYQTASGKLIGQATFEDCFYLDQKIETNNTKPRERDYSGSVNIAASRFKNNKFYFYLGEQGALENEWIANNVTITVTFS